MATHSATVCFVVRARNWVRSCFSCHNATKDSLLALRKEWGANISGHKVCCVAALLTLVRTPLGSERGHPPSAYFNEGRKATAQFRSCSATLIAHVESTCARCLLRASWWTRG